MAYRIIHSLKLELVPPPDAPPGARCVFILQLGRDGMPDCRPTNGRPRPPKTCTIGLRPTDQVLCDGRWRKIKGVSVYRDCWLSAEQAARARGDDGYLYEVATHR